MADSPTKRRKTRGPGMKTRKSRKLSWPACQLPVELFTLIISYLPRVSIQSMRLVNKEFEEKVSEYLFRVVVVPFKPEIYGIAPEPSQGRMLDERTSDSPQGSVMLQDKGMRVFQGFGHHILRFAMSFEFDEDKLARPPVKSDQEAITSFWGIYRWPFKKYNRYTQLEGLEQTADETRTMARALRFIKNAKELGLSIDGGLGWLAGPDINQKVIERGGKVSVFGPSRFIPESQTRPAPSGKATSSQPDLFDASFRGSSADLRNSSQYASIQRMLQEAGYQDELLEQSVQVMLETEELMAGPSEHSESFSSASNEESLREPTYTFISRLPNSTNPPVPPGNYASEDEDNETETETDLPTPSARGGRSKTDTYSLKPNDLTNAQREMLLEIEWAQRAFMQSYAIAIIDNPSTFKNIETLTIARLPNRHLPILRREDFWDGLPQLKKLTLAIIPDWRDVVKLPTSWVQDNKVAPSESISDVYQILQEQISGRENITTLHFEWLCGGEEAPGLFARNQHILAAPLVPHAMNMVNRTQISELLPLPFIENLTLKNCWISPHIMTRFGSALKQSALQSLTLDSVSLTASLPDNVQPNPITANAANPQIIPQMGIQAMNAVANAAMLNWAGGQNAQIVLPPGQPGQAAHMLQPILPLQHAAPAGNNHSQSGPGWLEPPRVDSWPYVIDALTPGQNLAAIRHYRDLGPAPVPRKKSPLRKLIFKSCGYVRLPLDFDQTILDPPDPLGPQQAVIAKRISDLDGFMMKSNDSKLGVIVNHISSIEEGTLENAWNLIVGWDRSRQTLAVEAQADGIQNPGKGRFEGIIEAPIALNT